MTWDIILQIILFGIALSMDAFAVSVISGLTMTDLSRKRTFAIAATFGVMQAAMPLAGFWIVEAVEVIVDSTAGSTAGQTMADIVTWAAFFMLLFIGGKMLFEAIKGLASPAIEPKENHYSYGLVFRLGIATSIDALATGVAFHNRNAEGTAISTTSTVWLHVSIILVITFALSLIGVLLGKQIIKLFKGKYEITSIIGGSILLILAAWILISHYVGI